MHLALAIICALAFARMILRRETPQRPYRVTEYYD